MDMYHGRWLLDVRFIGQLRIFNYGLRIENYEFNYELRIENYELRITNLITNYELRITN